MSPLPSSDDDAHAAKEAVPEAETRPSMARYLPLSHWRTVLTVLSLAIGTLLVAIDTTIISVAVPRIATDFAAFHHVGYMYRFFDAKCIYLSSVVVFEVGSVLCAAAPVSPVFILGRALQGIGAAGLYQGALSVIALTVALDKRPMVIGIVLSIFGLAVCFGPPVGGVLTDEYLFYLPFYFQSAQMVDARESGIRAIPLGLSQIVSVVVCSGLVTAFGHYVPFMIAGQLVAIVGNALLTRIQVDTPTAVWATYLVVTGIGTGMGLQTPFTAVQLVLRSVRHLSLPGCPADARFSKEDVPVGNAIVVFFQQLGAAVAVAAGQSIFSSGLQDELTKGNIPIPARAVQMAGPTGIRTLTTNPALIRLIQNAYCYAFRDTMYFALAALVVAIPFALRMQWLNARAVAKAAAAEEHAS
ncbi:hypothetical protein CDD83_7860 [Cordyceps sp. RAO-2017]|nr:hypothetical protein CDD83_7860 [Cordyceps sp. RAO-2017]